MKRIITGVFLPCLVGFTSLLSARDAVGQVSPAVTYTFRDPSRTMDERVSDLVSHLTMEEKVSQMQNAAPAIPRMGVPAYNWWSECLHGVGRNGIATVFPQAIGMAATWDPGLIEEEGDLVSTEARAKYRTAMKAGQHGVYQGLTFYSPNINIFRDPRWGRGQETYGEDPFLTARIGVAFVKGLQGRDPRYIKVVATAKHFAVHSGPESSRHKFDAWCSDRDLFETYLPAFEALVREGPVYSVMGAYNRFRNEPCCASPYLLDDILRKRWGFMGYITSDCGAIWDIWHGHALLADSVRPAAMGLRAGCDLVCGDDYTSLVEAVHKGYITETEIDQAVTRLFTARFRLGMFDPDSIVSWAGITPADTIGSRHLALKVARESIVLLKNEKHLLPLSKAIKSIAVIGPYADRISVLLGNYNGTPAHPVTILEGIREKTGNTARVTYAMGAAGPEDTGLPGRKLHKGRGKMMRDAMEAAKNSEVIIFAGGISPELEGEELQVEIPGFSGGDRTTLDLPANQTDLLQKLRQTGKPVVLVLTNGSAMSVNWEVANLAAIVEAWYPGEAGGNAVADVLFGDYNPAGRLPVTFYRSVKDLPPFDDYAMKGRTYRYFYGNPLFVFGHGLSYTSFEYRDAVADKRQYQPADTVALTIRINNTGSMAGDEVIQVYVKKEGTAFERPLKSLAGFSRVHLDPGIEKTIVVRIPVKEFRIYDPEKANYIVEPGKYQLMIGASSADIRLEREVGVK